MIARSLLAGLAAVASAPGIMARGRPGPLVSKPGETAAIPSWDLQSSADVSDDLASVSKPGADTSSWHHVPISKCTVMACLLETGVYDDSELWFSDNMRDFNTSIFAVPWVYRNEFALKPAKGRHFVLQTHGITSRADIYFNGKLIADKAAQSGSYSGHDYDVTDLVSKSNALLIQSYPTDYWLDLAMGFIDWNPSPVRSPPRIFLASFGS